MRLTAGVDAGVWVERSCSGTDVGTGLAFDVLEELAEVINTVADHREQHRRGRRARSTATGLGSSGVRGRVTLRP